MPTNLKPGNCTLKRTKLCTKIVININTCVRVGVGVGVGVGVDVDVGVVGVGDSPPPDWAAEEGRQSECSGWRGSLPARCRCRRTG